MTCLIFDLDGTLVDSEPLCNQAFLELVPELDDTLDALIQRYRGCRLSTILADIETRLGMRLPADFENTYRLKVAELFEIHLQPMPGAVTMLSELTHPMCICSGGPIEKVRHSVEIAGLGEFFQENIYSSYQVQSWKPDPGLFLHAAGQMGVSPSACIVIEDSKVGLEAAAAAGMRSVLFDPTRGMNTEHSVDKLSDLPQLLQSLS